MSKDVPTACICRLPGALRLEDSENYESWFDKVLERIKFYSKTHKLLITNATAHIDNLRAELIQMNESRQLETGAN